MLFAGVGENIDRYVREFPYDDRTYHYESVDHPATALRWLDSRVESLANFQLPYAVFCNLKWLRDDDFRFADALKAHPDLRFVPLIALADEGDAIDRESLSRHGIDDCYGGMIGWRLLERRLEFLNQYKSRLLEQARKEHFAFRMPKAKRIFDVAAASIGIVLSAPVWVPIALAIVVESKGPVIYKSKRVGAGYRVFEFLKFRSMYTGADQRIAELRHLNQYGEESAGAVFVKLVHDPRVTRVGRFIRKYSLDELPQLINVLRGEMSIVGNRPLPLYEAEMLTRDEWSARFLAPAGITGLWQVTKRGQSDMSAEERIALDIAYARNHSLFNDLLILLRTFGAIVQKEAV